MVGLDLLHLLILVQGSCMDCSFHDIIGIFLFDNHVFVPEAKLLHDFLDFLEISLITPGFPFETRLHTVNTARHK